MYHQMPGFLLLKSAQTASAQTAQMLPRGPLTVRTLRPISQHAARSAGAPQPASVRALPARMATVLTALAALEHSQAAQRTTAWASALAETLQPVLRASRRLDVIQNSPLVLVLHHPALQTLFNSNKSFPSESIRAFKLQKFHVVSTHGNDALIQASIARQMRELFPQMLSFRFMSSSTCLILETPIILLLQQLQ